MYAQGMSVREIQRFLEEQYKVEVSADLISTMTDSASKSKRHAERLAVIYDSREL